MSDRNHRARWPAISGLALNVGVVHTELVRKTALLCLLVLAGCTGGSDGGARSSGSTKVSAVLPPAVGLRSGASWADVVTAVRPSVLRIENAACDGSTFVGSGFAMGDWVVTNRHVVEDYSKLVVRLSDDRRLAPTRVLVSATDDLALLRIGEALPSLTWASTPPRVADEVAALGFPEAIGFSFAKGSVSALNVSLEYPGAPLRGLLQTDTAVNFGNSGGPLINRQGEVVGVVVLTLSNTEGLAFAIDSTRAARFVSGQAGRPLGACTRRPAAPVRSSSSAPPANTLLDCEKVVRAFYAAIDAGDFATAWEIGGKNFEKNSSYRQFVDGFDKTEKTELLVLDAVGDIVTVQVTARERTGSGLRTSVYRGTYLVRDGQIRSGGLKLHARR